jgi:ABC-type dipeptide/oligopeptide/nickel transport system permease component
VRTPSRRRRLRNLDHNAAAVPAEKQAVQRGVGRFVVGRLLQGLVFVLVVSSSALLLTGIAPGDQFAGFGSNLAAAAAARHRAGLDRPLAAQYAAWLARAARFDFGTSLKYQRPVLTLVAERAGNTVVLGGCALLLATGIGLLVGTLSGARRGGPLVSLARTLSLLLLSVPPLVTSFLLLLLAALTGWLPVGGFPRTPTLASLTAFGDGARYLILPTLALGLPLGAWLERLQAAAVRDALSEPSVQAARARGLSPDRLLWRHALRLSLVPVLSVYGLVVASVLSGSFAVEVVMSWPGLGALMYEGLVARDMFLVAGCAVAVSAFLAAGVAASDVALRLADPRRAATS